MANFEAKEFTFSEIHEGQRYKNGDIPDAEAINKPIEASYFAQELSKAAVSKSDQALNYAFGAFEGQLPTLSAYPIGSIYISVSPASPAQLFGGSWQRIEDKFLFAAGDSYALGTIGGEEAYKLKADQLPAHNHRIYIGQDTSNEHEIGNLLNSTFKNTSSWNSTYTEQTGKYKDGSGNFVDWGNGQKAINNMPPFVAVNIWKRIG